MKNEKEDIIVGKYKSQERDYKRKYYQHERNQNLDESENFNKGNL